VDVPDGVSTFFLCGCSGRNQGVSFSPVEPPDVYPKCRSVLEKHRDIFLINIKNW